MTRLLLAVLMLSVMTFAVTAAPAPRAANDEPFSVPVSSQRPYAGDSCRMTFLLPATAALWVDGVDCPLTGAERTFNTPSLVPGRRYSYLITVRHLGRVTQLLTDAFSARTAVTFDLNPFISSEFGVALRSPALPVRD